MEVEKRIGCQQTLSIVSCPIYHASLLEEHGKQIYFLLTTFQTLICMKIQMFIVGMLQTNCYVVSCQETQDAIIIDPGLDIPSEAEQIFSFVDECMLKVKFLVNTHGHQDHICGDKILKRKYNVPICIHAYDAHAIEDLDEGISLGNILLGAEDLLKFGKATLKVMHTPGHTPGSISLVGDKLVFTGDTLFARGIGRTDFPGGSDLDMRLSLEKLRQLPDDYYVYPGHGLATVMGEEKRFNPFLRML